ncbi:MAG: RNA polymerase sigma factor, partial [Desulfofustis sp.]|nr:RNA polymerase sigma factor [Desulfofustis sp.]
FYTDNRDKLFGYLLRKTGSVSQAADLVQESFTRYLERYRHGSKSPALLFTIGRNLFYDGTRHHKRFRVVEQHPEPLAEDQEHRYLAGEETRRIQHALSQLDEEERDLLALVVNSDLSYREIAGICRCSESNIKVKVHRARKKLRRLLEEYDNG